ncbi:hypothetical protein N0V85_008898 [Neurospora sp. IMI 360204]|nr:hypothetical protein N0V85_008898 [Neurospora sp. IMI 360204]
MPTTTTEAALEVNVKNTSATTSASIFTVPENVPEKEKETTFKTKTKAKANKPKEAIGPSRLAHSFAQGWLARLCTAQSFIDRARMERQFEDQVGYHFERINLSEIKLDWGILEKELGVERYMYRRTED